MAVPVTKLVSSAGPRDPPLLTSPRRGGYLILEGNDEEVVVATTWVRTPYTVTVRGDSSASL
jgi:hypothetical protein